MDFNKARTFVAVVDAGTVTKAAARLFRSQQAISHQIGVLEDELNIVLFRREGTGLALTREGRQLYEHAKENLTRLENAVGDLQAEQAEPQGTLRVGLWLEQATSVVPKLVARFIEAHPQVRFQWQIGDDAQLEPALIQGHIDIGFFLSVKDKRQIETMPVLERQLVLVAARRYLDRAKVPTIDDARALDIIDYAAPHSAFRVWLKKNGGGAAHAKEPRVEVDNDLAMKALVVAGVGAAVLPRDIIEAELASCALVELFPGKAKPVRVGIDLGIMRRRTPNALLSGFVDSVRGYCASVRNP